MTISYPTRRSAVRALRYRLDADLMELKLTPEYYRKGDLYGDMHRQRLAQRIREGRAAIRELRDRTT